MSAPRARPSFPRPNPGAGTGERGVALITVLILVAVLTAVVSRIGLSDEVWIRQTETGAALAQARQVSRAAQLWLGRLLVADDNDFDARTEAWARTPGQLPAAWGELSADVQDLQGRFNLNNLVPGGEEANPQAMTRFRRLLRILELNPGIASAAADWIDADSRPRGPGGAEDGFYTARQPPYFAANRPFEEAAELRLVREVDRSAWEALEPHVVALPEPTGINVNTATPEVLAAAVPAWGRPRGALARAREWRERVKGQPATELAAFLEAALPGRSESGPGGLTVGTRYFRAVTRARFSGVVHRLATTYHRRDRDYRILRQQRELR